MKKSVVVVVITILLISSGNIFAENIPDYSNLFLEQINHLSDIDENTGYITGYNKSNEKLLKALFGTEYIFNLYENNNYHKLNYQDWNEVLINDVNNLYNGIDNLLYESNNNKMDIWNNEYTNELNLKGGYLTSYLLEFRPTDIKKFSSRKKAYEILSNNIKDRKTYIEKIQENIHYRYSNTTSNEEGSFGDFVKKQEETLNKVENNFNENLDKTNIVTALQSMNKLMLQQNQILLKHTQALKDLNEQMSVIMSILYRKDMVEQLKEIKRKYK